MTVFARDRDDLESLFRVLEPVRRLLEATVLDNKTTPGFCRACRQTQEFEVAGGQPEGQWVNLQEGMVCRCGLNGRMRSILKTVHEVTARRRFSHAAVLERLTPLFPYLVEACDGLIGAEYLGSNMRPGQTRNLGGVEVRHENMLDLSFEQESVDLLMHFDVLEHVPDISGGLVECARVLRRDGLLIFSCPFYAGLEENTIRAVVVEGQVRHIMDPAYHGNPVSGSGSLVFTHPSWQVLAQLREAGFGEVRCALQYDPLEGIYSNACPYPDGHCWPVIFMAAKTAEPLDTFA